MLPLTVIPQTVLISSLGANLPLSLEIANKETPDDFLRKAEILSDKASLRKEKWAIMFLHLKILPENLKIQKNNPFTYSFVLYFGIVAFHFLLSQKIKGTNGQVTRADILQAGLRELLNALFSNPMDDNLICAVKLLKVGFKYFLSLTCNNSTPLVYNLEKGKYVYYSNEFKNKLLPC